MKRYITLFFFVLLFSCDINNPLNKNNKLLSDEPSHSRSRRSLKNNESLVGVQFSKDNNFDFRKEAYDFSDGLKLTMGIIPEKDWFYYAVTEPEWDSSKPKKYTNKKGFYIDSLSIEGFEKIAELIINGDRCWQEEIEYPEPGEMMFIDKKGKKKVIQMCLSSFSWQRFKFSKKRDYVFLYEKEHYVFSIKNWGEDRKYVSYAINIADFKKKYEEAKKTPILVNTLN